MKYDLIKKTEYVVDFGKFGTEVYSNFEDAKTRLLNYVEIYGKTIGSIFEQTVWVPKSIVQKVGYRVQFRTIKDVEWQNWTKTYSDSKKEALTAYQNAVELKAYDKNAQIRFEVSEVFSDKTSKISHEMVD